MLQLVQPPETFEESIDFEQRLETLEPLLFIVRRFLETLSLRIESVYLLIAELRLTLTLENGEKIVRILQIPAPTRDVDTLFGIAAQYLETLQTTAPVTRFSPGGYAKQAKRSSIRPFSRRAERSQSFLSNIGATGGLGGQ